MGVWLGVFFIGVLWLLSVLAAFNLLNFYWIFGYTEGNDFLWNWPFNFLGGGTVQFDYTALIGYEIVLILSFPFWYKFGATRFHHIFGRKPWQKGLTYILTVPSRPKGTKKGEKVVQAPLCDFKECEDDLSKKID